MEWQYSTSTVKYSIVTIFHRFSRFHQTRYLYRTVVWNPFSFASINTNTHHHHLALIYLLGRAINYIDLYDMTISSNMEAITNMSVRFSTIEIIEFPYTLLPSEEATVLASPSEVAAAVSPQLPPPPSSRSSPLPSRCNGDRGPKLTIEWDCQKRTVFNVDFFETYRPKRRTSPQSLLLSKSNRIKLLLQQGFRMDEILPERSRHVPTKKDVSMRSLPAVPPASPMIQSSITLVASTRSTAKKRRRTRTWCLLKSTSHL